MIVAKNLRFVKGTILNGIHFIKSPINKMVAFCDSDFVGDPNDRKSATGICVFLGNNLIMWYARKQARVSMSSVEFEHRSIAYSTTNIRWCSFLCRDLNICISPPTIFCDNCPTIFLTTNPMNRFRSIHIETDYHFVREIMNRSALALEFVSSTRQLEDWFRKTLKQIDSWN